MTDEKFKKMLGCDPSCKLYDAVGTSQNLIHILRCLMFPTGEGVLDRMWMFESLYGETFQPASGSRNRWANEIFPEMSESFHANEKIWVSGERLIERVGLVYDFEETVLLRKSIGQTLEFDLAIFFNGYGPGITTTDESTYNVLKSWFERTANADPSCFL